MPSHRYFGPSLSFPGQNVGAPMGFSEHLPSGDGFLQLWMFVPGQAWKHSRATGHPTSPPDLSGPFKPYFIFF